jgi:hypothetical protein
MVGSVRGGARDLLRRIPFLRIDEHRTAGRGMALWQSPSSEPENDSPFQQQSRCRLRYYDVTISDPVSGQVFQMSPTGTGFIKAAGGTTFTSWANGKNIAGALNIEFDVPIVPLHTPQGQFYLRVWGIGLPMISQASQLAGMNILMKVGMQKGLPLANPAQNGVILEGEIFQGYGNWEGVNQTLDLVFNAKDLEPDNGVNFNWAAGTPLKNALQQCFAQAFPGYKVNFDNLTATLSQSAPEAGTYPSLTTFAQYLQQRTQPMGASSTGNKSYPGVYIRIQSASKTIYAYDTAFQTVNLQFQDLIGQPTWIDPGTVNFKAVMRSDISVGNLVKFPQGVQQPFALTSTIAAPGSPASSKTAFQGNFRINDVHHFGNFRQADAQSWNTTFRAVAMGT